MSEIMSLTPDKLPSSSPSYIQNYLLTVQVKIGGRFSFTTAAGIRDQQAPAYPFRYYVKPQAFLPRSSLILALSDLLYVWTDFRHCRIRYMGQLPTLFQLSQ